MIAIVQNLPYMFSFVLECKTMGDKVFEKLSISPCSNMSD